MFRFFNSTKDSLSLANYRCVSRFSTFISEKSSNGNQVFKNMSKKALREEWGGVKKNEKNFIQSKAKAPPSEIYLCVLGNGSPCSPRALYMFTEHGRYLFNCGEGTQRIAHEYKMKLSKLNNIFITHSSWENLGGLLGLSLTVQDIGVSEINLHGPQNIDSLYDYATSFLSTKAITIRNKTDIRKPFIDSCMEVQYIPIEKESSSTSIDTSVDSAHEHNSYPSSKKIKFSEKEESSDITIAYACKGHSKPGHLSLEKCVEYGVPPGPLLGELKSGKDITLSSGKIVFSKDVVSEDQPCPVFLVVECPSEGFLNPFVNELKFSSYQATSNVQSNIASLVVHFTPPHILRTCQYQEWIKRFPDTTIHMILNCDNATLCSAAVHRIQHKLNLLHQRVFTLLHESDQQATQIENNNNRIIQANTLNRFYLRPFSGFEDSTIVLDSTSYIQEANNAEGFENSLQQLKSTIKLKQQESTWNEDKESPEIVFLGTGSSIPSKVRNVSGIIVHVSNGKYIIMDCGEGTYNQLFRLFGSQVTNLILQQLCCIFISHMHADHHLGLIQLLKFRKIALRDVHSNTQPLIIVGPWKLHEWLKNYHTTFEPIFPQYRFFQCSSLKYDFRNISDSEEVILKESCQNISISTVPVNHCPDAHGLILSHDLSKWKIVYSGDTTPCDALIAAGKDCTLLIHEATMEDDLSDEAALKRHSTTSEAIKIANKMNAQFTILTHFSQRYAKVPLFSEDFHNHIGCAFDNMKVYLHELYILPLFIPTLKHLFAEDMQELQVKGNKRERKRNLIKSIVLSNSIN